MLVASIKEYFKRQEDMSNLTAQAIRKELLFDRKLKEKMAIGDGKQVEFTKARCLYKF